METLVREPALDACRALLRELIELRESVAVDGQELVGRWRDALRREEFLPSALNLAHYIALRRRDLRSLQEALMPLGLSSLGRCEARVQPNLDAVIAALAALAGEEPAHHPGHPDAATFYEGNRLLMCGAEAALGPAPAHRAVRIMVTLATPEALDPAFVRELVGRGCDVVRINCAHDTPEAWAVMVGNARRAARETGRPCRVLVDLEGPRARTGRISPEGDLRVAVGETVRLVAGPPAARGPIPEIECSLPAAVAQLHPGCEVCVDEGRIRLRCERAGADAALLRVARVESKGRIKSHKGLNFPGLNLNVDPLTAKDLADLEAVAPLADVVGYSFVQSADDMARLQGVLARLVPARRLGVVAKIETAQAVRNLPGIIVQGAGSQPLAVMIARGDLAVEIGFGRLAEIQEEILWLCEAAHVPVIWATAVLDTFVRRGSHSRAEMTDAAMAERAECVMLNRGPHVLEAVGILDDVLGRMEAHQVKKTSRLRALHAW